ncbi:hypothetical protein F0L68_40770 [Solihabitans fulvus]|uniref:Uncharacterized protein n=1 Tax=Solihabitans fulvus TaxID=1892852 RepID=A0A5B2W6T0_9PSEU|nr:hypothetical protein F0L68_40770 [Solihabitans fulvus]
MTHPTNGYPPPVPLRPHQQGQAPRDWQQATASDHPGWIGRVQPANQADVAQVPQAGASGAELVPESEAVGRAGQ